MTDQSFVPISYYLNSNVLDFIDLSEGFLDKIGILETNMSIEEKETNATIKEET